MKSKFNRLPSHRNRQTNRISAVCRSGLLLFVSIFALLPALLAAADPLDTWYWRNPLPQGNQLFGVTHGNGLFVAVGAARTIVTSPDTTNWTIQTSSLTNNSIVLRAVTHANGQFVAVGSSGTILTSPNGTNWTSRVAATNLPLNSVTYGNGLFVAVGGFSGFSPPNTIQTSLDGVLWTPRTTPTNGGLFGVTFANNLFVAVGGGTTFGGGRRVFSSTDGTNWSTAFFTVNGGALYTVTYGNGTFVTAGGFLFPSPLVGTSALGTTNWTFTQPVGHRLALAFGNDLFVGVGGTTSTASEEAPTGSQASYSTNGTNWSYIAPFARAIPGSLEMNGVTFANGMFVAVGHPGVIITSTTGTNWTKRTMDMGGGGGGIYGLAHGSGRFMAAQQFSLFGSTDGVTWTNTGAMLQTGGSIRDVVHGNGKFVFFGFQGTQRYLSAYDPTTGTTTHASGTIGVSGVAFGNGTFVRIDVPPAGTNQSPIYTSTNGTQWTLRDSGTNANLLSIFFDGTRFMTKPTTGTAMLTSTDGITWTAQPTTGAVPLFFAYGNGLYLAGTGGSQIRYSTNGFDWTTAFFPNPFGYSSGGVRFANGHFFAVIGSFTGAGSAIYTSTNGASSPPTNAANWTLRAAMSPNIQLFVDVVFGNDRYLATGAGDTIMQSDSISTGSQPTLANARRLVGGEFEFDILAQPSQLVRIDAKTNLAQPEWTTLGTVTITNVPQLFRDSAAGSFLQRFYQGVVP